MLYGAYGAQSKIRSLVTSHQAPNFLTARLTTEEFECRLKSNDLEKLMFPCNHWFVMFFFTWEVTLLAMS